MPEPDRPTLVRAIGRWSLAALTINCIIGSGIFGLPSQISGSLGKASPIAWIFAAVATALVMACFAEVSSRFDQTGGVYLYSRTAFGRPTGIAIAWLGWLARLTAAAANANLFVTYFAQFWPSAQEKWSRIIVLTVVLSILTAVNYVGVRRGTLQSNLFTAAKLITLGGFILAALVFVGLKHRSMAIALPAGPFRSWRDAILLLVFAYGGYETALMPGGEARNPRRDYPFALFVALIVCTVVYTMTQWVIVSLLPQSAMTDRPLATAAQFMFGSSGAAILSIGVLVSCYGYLSANVLGFPRLLFALAEQGDLPAVMGRVHPRFRTPHIAILVFAVLLYAFSLAGSFQWNLVISAVSRLFYYGSVCAALPVLRRKSGIPDTQFHLPMGDLIAVLAVATSLSLLLSFPRLDMRSGTVLAVVALGVLGHSLWASRYQRTIAATELPRLNR